MLNRRLQMEIASLPGFSATSNFEVLQCSSSHATGAIIFHVRIGRRKQLDVIVKTPRDPASNHAIELEWDSLTSLTRHSGMREIVPMPLRRFEVDGVTFYAYGAIPGRTMFARFRDRTIVSCDRMRARFGRQALHAAVRLHASHSRMESAGFLAQDLDASYRALASLVGTIPDVVSRRVAEASHFFSNARLELPVGGIHGDFSPYNLMTSGSGQRACIGIIDWEHCERDRPQHIDIFRFIGGCELMGRARVENAASLRRMCDVSNPVARTLLVPWLEKMAPAARNIIGDPQAYAALWVHYWVCAAHREQDRQPNPADAGRTTYFPGMCELFAA